MSWNAGQHPRDELGRFRENATARLAEQIAAASRRGDFSTGFTPVRQGHSGEPEAKRRGFVRVGDHPTRMGAVGGQESYFGTSTHPDAGGVWIDPARPGTRVAPRFVNDFGSPIAALKPAKSRSQQRQEDISSRRREDWSSVPEGQERRGGDDGGKIGRRLEGAPEAFVKDMRRAQARSRAESGRTPVRRTPRGTLVEGWMVEADKRIGARRGA